jgi:cytochrome c oxidase subunit II
MSRNVTSLIIVLLIAAVLGYAGYNMAGRKLQNNPNSDPNTREIVITARQFSFSPDPIRVKLNEKVRFRVKTADVAHGMLISDFGFNLKIRPGQETVGEFQATKRGEFTVRCSVFCGGEHPTMTGKLIVE